MYKLFIYTSFLMLPFLSSCSLFEEEVIPIDIEEKAVNHLALGNPSDAQDNEILVKNYLIEKEQYALAYNGDRGIPTWVSWNLNNSWLGSVSRSDDFLVDFDIPSGITRTTTSDYSGSGFDRGHNCPSADRTLTRRDNQATFVMSNIIPQAPEHNQQLWREMEEFSRDLVRRDGKELYIIMGNYDEGGEGRFGKESRIGTNGRVAVPKYIWKVVVVINEGEDDLFRVDKNTRVIAILTENRNSNLRNWYDYRVSVDEIETKTGLDLLSELPTALQRELEGKVDDGPI